MTTATLTIAANKRKIWDRAYYLRKKLRLLDGAIATVVNLNATTNPTAMATADSVAAVAAITDGLSLIADVAAAADPWSLDNNGVVRTPSARRKAKSRQVKPAVDAILRAGSIDAQAAVLRAVADHTSLKDACDLARISSSKEQAAHKFLCEQSARMMERNRATEKLRANVTSDKRLAAEVMLTFSAPSPDKVRGVPSQRDRARVLGVPQSIMSRLDKVLIEKRRQLTADEKGVYWALAKRKKGYSTINEELRVLLIAAFHDHPHVIVSPNAKDTLKVKDADGEKVSARKVLTQVGLGTIFSDIVRDNPTIKGKVAERAFRYIVSALGCVRRFTDSYKQMCGCTECVGLHTLHRSLQAKRGVMHRQFAIDAQYRTRKAQAAEKARGWGLVALDPTATSAISAGTCTRWSSHSVPHWECQTLQCADCKDYPVPKEEAREDASAEDISFHVYEYKVSVRKDGKERRRLELVQKRAKIGEFHRRYYGPALGRGRYHSTSYRLAARCRKERRAIKRGSVSTHRDYGERMPISFNEEIQSGYYQNTSVSVEGASLEWVDGAGETLTRYFGHWSDDSKQDAAATTRNMRCELCVDGDATQLVEGLDLGGTVYKGTDGAATSYRCGKSIFGQALLSAELGIAIDAHVEAPGHGKWWLDGKTGADKRYCQRCMCCIICPQVEDSEKNMLSAKWVERDGETIAVSPADECVRLLSHPSRVNGIKSEGMRAKRENKVLVSRNEYASYTMGDVPLIPDYKVVLPKGKFNGIRAHYNIRTDPDLGVGWAAMRRVACGCGPCKEQLERPWVPLVEPDAQPRYAQNKECAMWHSYEGANDWKCCALVPKTEADEKEARKSIRSVLHAFEARMSLTVHEGEVGAVGTTDEAANGYYLVKWISEPYTLQADTEGMSGIISAGKMVVDAVYFNRVQRAPLWYTPSAMVTIMEVKHILKTGLQVQPISATNALPRACATQEATRKKAVKVSSLDHEAIMEEATKRDRLDYGDEEEDEDEDADEDEDEDEYEDEDEDEEESE